MSHSSIEMSGRPAVVKQEADNDTESIIIKTEYCPEQSTVIPQSPVWAQMDDINIVKEEFWALYSL